MIPRKVSASVAAEAEGEAKHVATASLRRHGIEILPGVAGLFSAAAAFYAQLPDELYEWPDLPTRAHREYAAERRRYLHHMLNLALDEVDLIGRAA